MEELELENIEVPRNLCKILKGHYEGRFANADDDDLDDGNHTILLYFGSVPTSSPRVELPEDHLEPVRNIDEIFARIAVLEFAICTACNRNKLFSRRTTFDLLELRYLYDCLFNICVEPHVVTTWDVFKAKINGLSADISQEKRDALDALAKKMRSTQ